MSILVGLLNDDLNSSTLSFLILGVAGLEFSVGFLILLLFKNTNNSYYLTKKDGGLSKANTNPLNQLVFNQINF